MTDFDSRGYPVQKQDQYGPPRGPEAFSDSDAYSPSVTSQRSAGPTPSRALSPAEDPFGEDRSLYEALQSAKGIGGTIVGAERDKGAEQPTFTHEEMMSIMAKMQAAEAAKHRAPPEWLQRYMVAEGEAVPTGPNMGTTQMGGPIDKVKGKQYLSQQQMLKRLKAQK